MAQNLCRHLAEFHQRASQADSQTTKNLVRFHECFLRRGENVSWPIAGNGERQQIRDVPWRMFVEALLIFQAFTCRSVVRARIAFARRGHRWSRVRKSDHACAGGNEVRANCLVIVREHVVAPIMASVSD